MLAGCISGNGTQDAKLNIIDDNYRNYYDAYINYKQTKHAIGLLNPANPK